MYINDDSVLHEERNCPGPKKGKKHQPVYKRLKAEAIFYDKGQETHARNLGLRYNSSLCNKPKLKSCETLLDADRSKIFRKC